MIKIKQYNTTRISNVDEILFFSLVLFTCFQNISIYDFGNFSFKANHLISLLFIFLLIRQKKIILPSKNINIFFFIIIIISFFQYNIYGFHNLIFNYIFGYYLLILILTIGNNIEYIRWIDIIKKVSIIIMISTIIKIIINRQVIFSFFIHPNGHPGINSFFGGGVNLEASWIALLGVSFYKDKKVYIYFILSLIISILYASRVGIIACFLLGIFIIIHSTRKLSIKSIIGIILSFVCIVAVLLTLYLSNISDYIINRFIIIGSDPGSIGRLRMWVYVKDAFLSNPFGYGIGNATKALNIVSDYIIKDGNVHNLFMQMLLDTGFIGFIYYCYMVFNFIKNNKDKIFKEPVVSFIFFYILLSLFQFRGGDSLLFLFVGLYLLSKRFDLS